VPAKFAELPFYAVSTPLCRRDRTLALHHASSSSDFRNNSLSSFVVSYTDVSKGELEGRLAARFFGALNVPFTSRETRTVHVPAPRSASAHLSPSNSPRLNPVWMATTQKASGRLPEAASSNALT